MGVSRNGSTSILGCTFSVTEFIRISRVEETVLYSTVSGVEGHALLGSVANSIVQEGVDLIGGVNLDVNESDHGNEHSEDDHGVQIRRHESSLESTGGGVKNNSPGNEERSKLISHTSQSCNGGGTTEQKHRSNDDISAESEEEEGKVSRFAPTSADNLTHSVGGGSNVLEGDGEHTEEEDLDGRSRCIPERINKHVESCIREEHRSL